MDNKISMTASKKIYQDFKKSIPLGTKIIYATEEALKDYIKKQKKKKA